MYAVEIELMTRGDLPFREMNMIRNIQKVYDQAAPLIKRKDINGRSRLRHKFRGIIV